MLEAYFDDSGTHENSPVVVIGGLMGLADHWRSLENDWRALLANPLPETNRPPLKAFHLSHCVGHWGEFDTYSQAESDLLRYAFRQIILRSHLFQLSAVVSRPDWDELAVPPYRQFMGTAEEACFLGFIRKSLDILRQASVPNLKIAYMYDIGRRTEKFDHLIRLTENQQFRPEIAGVSWGRVAETPALQAADTIATENYWAAQKWLADGNLTATSAHFQRLLEGMAGEGLILDREAIQNEINHRGPDGKLK